MDRICIGGDKGCFLSARISEFAQDFSNYYNNFSAHGYDCADPEDESYDDDYFTFKEKVLAFPPKERINLNFTMPPYAASVYWAKNMDQTITTKISQFRSLELPGENDDHTQLMYEKFIELSRILHDFQKATFNEWFEKMNREANDYLKEYILGRCEFQDVQLNFNYEVRFCQQQNILGGGNYFIF